VIQKFSAEFRAKYEDASIAHHQVTHHPPSDENSANANPALPTKTPKPEGTLIATQTIETQSAKIAASRRGSESSTPELASRAARNFAQSTPTQRRTSIRVNVFLPAVHGRQSAISRSNLFFEMRND